MDVEEVPQEAEVKPIVESGKIKQCDEGAQNLLPRDGSEGYVSPGIGKKTEKLWSYYILHKNPIDKEQHYVICHAPGLSGNVFCKKKIKSTQSSTTGLRTHLRSFHQNCWMEVEKFEADYKYNHQRLRETMEKVETGEEYAPGTKPRCLKRSSLTSSSSASDAGPSISKRKATFPGRVNRSKRENLLQPKSSIPDVFKAVVKHNTKSKFQLRFDMEVMKYLVNCNLPFPHANTEGFQNFVKFLNPTFYVKDISTFSSTKLPLLYADVKRAVDEKLEREVSYCTGVGFTTDMWSSGNFDPYMSLTIHYITKDWEMERVLVYCGSAEWKHTGVNIANHLDKVISELPISGRATPRRVCTMDNARNTLTAMKNCKSLTTSLPCIDQTLQLVVNSALDSEPAIVKALEAFKRLAARTHKGSLDQQRIKKECISITQSKENDTTLVYKKIITPVPTDWKSTLMMVQSILHLRQALENIKEDYSEDQDKCFNSDPNLRAVIPEPEHFEQLQAIVKPLEEVAKIMAELSDETTPTSCLVVPKLYSLQLVLKHQIRKSKNDATRAYCQKMLDLMEQRLPLCGSTYPTYAVACLLHPGYKCFILEELVTTKTALDYLVQNFDAAKSSQESGSSPTSDEDSNELLSAEAVAQQKQKELWRQSKANVGDSQATYFFPSAKTLTPIQIELNGFYKEETYKDQSILYFWRKHTKTYPLLAAAAKELLCIQATSCSSERAFSTGGLTHTSKRRKLDPENVHYLVYCMENLPKVNIKSWIYKEAVAD